jgi:hypothetical protein
MTYALIVARARTLLDAVTFDDSGVMVAGTYRGGNGGLLSRETIKAADALRVVLDAYAATERQHEAGEP